MLATFILGSDTRKLRRCFSLGTLVPTWGLYHWTVAKVEKKKRSYYKREGQGWNQEKKGREVSVEVGIMLRFCSEVWWELSDPLVFPQLVPYFHTCGYDCIRRKGTVVLCPQTGGSFPLDESECPVSVTVTGWSKRFRAWRASCHHRPIQYMTGCMGGCDRVPACVCWTGV